MKYQWGAVVVLAVLTVGSYAPSLSSPFVYEDANWINAASGDESLSRPPSRAMTMWTLGMTTTPTSAHVMNLAIHLATGLALYMAAMALGGASSVAILALSVFWLHPVNAESVIYAVGRTDLLMTLCATLAVWAIIANHPLVAIAPVIVSLYTKESAIVVPLVAVWTWYRFRPSGETAPRIRALLAGLGVLAILLVWRRYSGSDEFFSGLWVSQVAVQMTAFWVVLLKVVYPFNLSIDHDVWSVPHVAQLCAVLATFGLVGAAWLLRRQWPVYTWAIGAVLLSVAPRLIVAPPEALAERQFYLPMTAICLAIGYVARRYERC